MSLKKILLPYALVPQETQQLQGYASLNYRIQSEGTNYLLKHYTDPSEYDLICEENRILQQLKEKELSFALPYALQDIHTYKDRSFSRLLPFLEGKLLSSVTQTDELLENFGRVTAQLNTHLLPLKSDTIQARVQEWDMKHTLLNFAKAHFIKNPQDRKIVTYYLDLFEHTIAPIQQELRHSIIHSDLNDNNVLIAGNEVVGLIDFGDIAYSPLVYEVAIALTYIMMANPEDPFTKAQAFLKGYHQELPFLEEEIELLHLLIASRLCVSVCNSAQKKSQGEDTAYVLISEKPAWNLLHKWIAINPIKTTNRFKKTLGFSIQNIAIDTLKAKRQHLTGPSLSTSYKEPICMTGGAFQYMYDHLGNTYLDAYNNIPHVGHGHPNISRALSKQARILNTNTRYLNPVMLTYAETLTHKLPSTLHTCFFVNAGSEASDLAIRMARTHTQRDTIAILKHGYHGHTQIGISISDYKHSGKGGSGTPQHIITLPLPKEYNGTQHTGEAYAQEAIQLLELAIAKGNTPAALIAEPLSGCGGQVPLAKGYLKTLKPFLEQHSILLIIDEVQVGFGRLGTHFWGFEMHEVLPDMVVMGKPMGNGHPIAAAVTTSEVAASFANGMEFFTSFGGNPVSCAVALAVLNTIEEEELQANALEIGTLLKNGLLQLQKTYPCIGDVRGSGLFLGIECIDTQNNPSAHIASFIVEHLKAHFILSSIDGPHNNVIKMKPPLCFNKENTQQFLKEIEIAMQDAALKKII